MTDRRRCRLSGGRYDQFQIGDIYCGGYSSEGVNAYGGRFADEFARAMAVSNPQNG